VNTQYHYLDSSAVLAWLLEGRAVLERLEGEPKVASLRLLWVEVSRALYRALQTNRLSPSAATHARHTFERLAAGIGRIHMSEAVYRRAEGPYPLVVRPVDALHLAAAEVWLSETEHATEPPAMAVWTLDERMNHCAAQLGFRTPLLDL